MFDEFGTIDILINNAGLQGDAAFDQMTLYPGFATGGSLRRGMTRQTSITGTQNIKGDV